MTRKALKKTTRAEEQADVSKLQVISSQKGWDAKLKKFNGKQQTKTLTVEAYSGAGNKFVGELTFRYWWSSPGVFFCYCEQYRITAAPHNSDNHKANIHFSFDSTQWWGKDSPDAMRQDATWHAYKLGGWVGANGRARVYVEFVFDVRQGADPVKSGHVWLDFAKIKE